MSHGIIFILLTFANVEKNNSIVTTKYQTIFDTSYVYISTDSLNNDVPCLSPTGFDLEAIDTATKKNLVKKKMIIRNYPKMSRVDTLLSQQQAAARPPHKTLPEMPVVFLFLT